MNKMAINQRLDAYLINEKISNEDLRKLIGLKSPAQISNWRTLKEPLPAGQSINIIAACRNLNARWFLTGEGPMVCSKEYDPPVPVEKKISDSVVTVFACKDCIEKEKVILAQAKTINAMELTVELQQEKGKKLASENAELKFLLAERKKSSA